MPFKPARRESDHPAGPAFFMAPAEGRRYIQQRVSLILPTLDNLQNLIPEPFQLALADA